MGEDSQSPDNLLRDSTIQHVLLGYPRVPSTVLAGPGLQQKEKKQIPGSPEVMACGSRWQVGRWAAGG